MTEIPKGWELIEDAPSAGPMAFLNRGIAGIADAPIALSSAIGRGVAGAFGYDSPPIPLPAQSAMGAIGVRLPAPGEVGDTYGERAAEGAGAALGAVLPFMGASGVAARYGGPVASGVGNALRAPFTRAPASALGVETTAGAASGAGGLGAERSAEAMGLSPQSARTLGELGGGLMGGVLPLAAGAAMRASPVGAIVKRTIAPFTEAGGRQRASDRVRSLVADPDAAARALDEPGVADLSPAQRTGDPGLMALERAVADTDPAFAARLRERADTARGQLTEAANAPTGGASPQDAQSFMRDRRERLTAALNARIEQAQKRIQERTAELSPQRRETDNSVIVRQELDRAWSDARAQERELWAAVPRDASAPTSATRSAFDGIVRETPSAQQEDIPSVARQLLSEDGGAWQGTQTQSVAELHGLYSKLREVARNARSGTAPQRNKARIADLMAEAILVDLGARANDPGRIGQTINAARTFSAQVSERFEQGTVGRLLGQMRDGGDAVDPQLTLGATVGRGGAAAKVSVDDIRAAAGRNGDGATQDYLLRRFRDYAAPRGELDRGKAQDFMRQNAEVLDQFPQLRDRLAQTAGETGTLARRVDTDAERVAAINDPRQSPGAGFASAPYAKEFTAVLSARNPAEAARSLRREAARDPSGQALGGLKAAVLGHVMKGDGPGKGLSDPRTLDAAREILAPDEMQRLNRIAQEFRLLDQSERSASAVGGVISDTPNAVISVLGRVMAARQGARLANASGGGNIQTPGIFSARMKDLLGRLTNDKAETILRRAVEDPELFRDLLQGVTPQNSARIEGRLAPYLASEVGQMANPDQGPAAPPIPDGWEIVPDASPPPEFAPRADASPAPLPARVDRIVNAAARQDRPVAPITLARAFVGASESRDGRVIGAFLKKFGGTRIDPAATPWCAAFVNAVLGASGNEGTGKLNARSFLEWGEPAERPTLGDVAVFSRGDPNGWQGHVGFFAGYETKNGQRYVRVVGGNQNDSVNEKLYPESRLLGFRRPVQGQAT